MPPSARNINNTLTGEIITLVCEAWGVTRPELVSRSRKQPLPWARSQLCHYLRLYAGHDCVSCAAMLNISDISVLHYNYRYTRLLHRYTPFRDRDDQISSQIKALIHSPEP